MFKKNKILVIVLIIPITVLAIGFLVFTKSLQNDNLKQIQNDKNKSKKVAILNSQKVEKKVFDSNSKGFSHFSPTKGTELIIAPYQYTWDMTNQKLLESYGILVFRRGDEGKIQKIDKIEYSYGTACFVSFSEERGVRDFNNDDIKELIIETVCRGERGFSIYGWFNNSTLRQISPVDSEGNQPFGITLDNNFEFVDIDNNGKIEASLLYEDLVRLGPGVNDIRIDIYRRIYKWDGTEKPYYLWKEETSENTGLTGGW